MTKVNIGSKELDIPPLNFRALKYAWPYVRNVMEAPDNIAAVDAGLHIIAAGFAATTPVAPGESTFKAAADSVYYELCDELSANDLDTVNMAVVSIIQESGLGPKTGEADPPAMESPSTVTLPVSSQSSLPGDAKEVPGAA